VKFTILGFFKLEHQQRLKITKAYDYDLEGKVMQRTGLYAGWEIAFRLPGRCR
jgi:hypothetical protein